MYSLLIAEALTHMIQTIVTFQVVIEQRQESSRLAIPTHSPLARLPSQQHLHGSQVVSEARMQQATGKAGGTYDIDGHCSGLYDPSQGGKQICHAMSMGDKRGVCPRLGMMKANLEHS